MNETRLRKLAQKVNREKAEKEREEQEEKERQARDQAKAAEERRLQEWPAYIEKKIEEAAASGEFSYEFECGDCGERVLKELGIHFASLNPSVGQAKRTRIVNYDMGTDEVYYTTVITFRW